ncbi:MAG: 4-hydroxythreonine-4-phosphate dehydrogenase PdxA [Candidatus Omnitrophota bacterium]
MSKKSIIITSGDPAGCGPFITLEAVNKSKLKNIDFFVTGDRKIFEKFSVFKKVKEKINLIDADTKGIEKIKKGQASKLSGVASLSYINQALKLMKQKNIKRIVTAPLSKEAVKLTEDNFSGHTEYLANYFKINNFAMMMASKNLKVILLSRHILLRDVSCFLNEKNIYDALSLVYSSLKRQFKVKNPKIAFASLNPHAGVNTFLESEERRMAEAIHRFQKKIYGPYPADTLFIPESLQKYDCVLCPYHDQGMIPFKMLSFYDGVNVTLGLPIIRTSPAHGTAFDLIKAEKKPFSASMEAAINLALMLDP